MECQLAQKLRVHTYRDLCSSGQMPARMAVGSASASRCAGAQNSGHIEKEKQHGTT
jgi:hypothetical protein